MVIINFIRDKEVGMFARAKRLAKKGSAGHADLLDRTVKCSGDPGILQDSDSSNSETEESDKSEWYPFLFCFCDGSWIFEWLSLASRAFVSYHGNSKFMWFIGAAVLSTLSRRSSQRTINIWWYVTETGFRRPDALETDWRLKFTNCCFRAWYQILAGPTRTNTSRLYLAESIFIEIFVEGFLCGRIICFITSTMSVALKQSESNITPFQECIQPCFAILFTMPGFERTWMHGQEGQPSCNTGSCGRELAKLNDIYLTDASRLILVWSGKDSQYRHRVLRQRAQPCQRNYY